MSVLRTLIARRSGEGYYKSQSRGGRDHRHVRPVAPRPPKIPNLWPEQIPPRERGLTGSQTVHRDRGEIQRRASGL